MLNKKHPLTMQYENTKRIRRILNTLFVQSYRPSSDWYNRVKKYSIKQRKKFTELVQIFTRIKDNSLIHIFHEVINTLQKSPALNKSIVDKFK